MENNNIYIVVEDVNKLISIWERNKDIPFLYLKIVGYNVVEVSITNECKLDIKDATAHILTLYYSYKNC